MIEGMEQLPYHKRLQRLGLIILIRKILGGAVMEVYKIVMGVDKVNRSQNTRTRGYPWKLAGDKFKTNKRKYFFMEYIIYGTHYHRRLLRPIV